MEVCRLKAVFLESVESDDTGTPIRSKTYSHSLRLYSSRRAKTRNFAWRSALKQDGLLEAVYAGQTASAEAPVTTPYLAAVVKGTQFQVTVNNNETHVDVFRGQVEVTDFKSGQLALVLPGQSAKVSAHGLGGLSLHGAGTLSPIQQGEPRAPSVSPLSKEERSALRGISNGQKLHIASPLGDVKLNIHQVTKGLAHAEIGSASLRRDKETGANAGQSNNDGGNAFAKETSGGSGSISSGSSGSGLGNGGAGGLGNGLASGLGNGLGNGVGGGLNGSNSAVGIGSGGLLPPGLGGIPPGQAKKH